MPWGAAIAAVGSIASSAISSSGGSGVPSGNTLQGVGKLETLGDTLNTQGTNLQSYLTSGTLPPAVQANLNTGELGQEAGIKSQYGAMGIPGSSAALTDLATAKQNEFAQGASIATSLYNTGVTELGMAGNFYQNFEQDLMGEQGIELGNQQFNEKLQADASSGFGSALGSLFGGSGGGGGMFQGLGDAASAGGSTSSLGNLSEIAALDMAGI